ncbi:MAG: hypothetical protein IPN96_15810 [Anaerolineales bacterium]|nr:hypothetical protein [Anaerolineales bacterium]
MLIVFVITMSFLAYSSGQSVRAAGTILYAASGGLTSGTCSSWASACDLPYVLSVAVFSDEIWVKQGTYKPTNGADRTISFVLKDGVSLYGGFVGTETLRSQRATSASLTILSGDIGVSGDATDNSYHVIFASETTNTTVIDGFTITGGFASGFAPNSFGAGMYNDSGSPALVNVVFNSNFSSDNGGGVYNAGGNPTFNSVTFSENKADSGGAIFNFNGNLTMADMVFNANQAYKNLYSSMGGAIFNGGILSIDASSFYDNAAMNGGCILNAGTLRITNSNFYSNRSNLNYATSTSVSGVNSKIGFSLYGGCINNYGITTVSYSTFSGNTAGYSGGGIYNDTSGTLVVLNSTFSDNQAVYYGGAIYALGTTSIHNSTFSKNQVTNGNGGGVFSNSNLDISNSTFSENNAKYFGGGVYNDGGALHLKNSLLANSVNGGDCFNFEGDTINTNINNLIESNGSSGFMCGTASITGDPKLGLLADNGGSTQSLALLPGSLAIDMGDDTVCAISPINNLDQRGVSRSVGSHCDIGAYEYVDINLVNSVLPTSRSIPVGTTATIFNTVINAGTSTAHGVTISMVEPPTGIFDYQQTDCNTNVVIGMPNVSLELAPGGVLCYVLSFTPSAPFAVTNVHIQAQANNAPSTNLLTGINTWLLRSTAVAGPDVIALTTTTDFHQVACTGANAFAVALSNVGVAATGDITVTANTGAAFLPISISVSETNPGTGAIIGDNILQGVGAGENRTVAVFVTFGRCILFDPAANRIFIEFRDASNNVVGSTSTAVSTNR